MKTMDSNKSWKCSGETLRNACFDLLEIYHRLNNSKKSTSTISITIFYDTYFYLS